MGEAGVRLAHAQAALDAAIETAHADGGRLPSGRAILDAELDQKAAEGVVAAVEASGPAALKRWGRAIAGPTGPPRCASSRSGATAATSSPGSRPGHPARQPGYRPAGLVLTPMTMTPDPEPTPLDLAQAIDATLDAVRVTTAGSGSYSEAVPFRAH